MHKILHVDGDGFFAACEVARRPELRGRPVVVGEDRGIACAMSYEAKRLGITRAMPIFQIRKQFPQVTVLPTHFELYDQYSEKLYRLLSSHLGNVEWYSIDECFAEIPESFMARYGSWDAALRFLKQEIQHQIGITYSFGLADTKVLAKIASKLRKPDGCVVLHESLRLDALAATPIESVWGIGWKTSEKLKRIEIATAHDFINYPEDSVKRHFAEPIRAVWYELQNVRIHAVQTRHEPQKSLQATRSFSPASSDAEFVYAELARNVEIACARLRAQGMLARSFGVYLKSKSISRRFTSMHCKLPDPTHNPIDLLRMIRVRYSEWFDPRFAYRATGVAVHDLIHMNDQSDDLFGFGRHKREVDGYLASVDQIRRKFGTGAIMIGSSMTSVTRRAREQQVRDARDTYQYGLPLPYLGEVR